MIPPATTISAAGTAFGAQRLSATSTATLPPPIAAVGQSISPRCESADHSLSKKWSPVWSIPSSLPSWPTAIRSPVPALKPASTGCEMKSAMKPSLSSPAASSSTPVSTASVEAAVIARCASPRATTPMAAAVSAASVEVVETDSARELPSSAYTSSGTAAV